MGVKKNSYAGNGVYNVVYSGIRGVDFSQDEEHSSRSRLAYAENLYRDYDGDSGAIIESIPGFRKIFSALGRIYGLFSFTDEDGNDHLVIHANTSVYRYPLAEIDKITTLESICNVASKRTCAFKKDNALYLLDGGGIIKITKDYASRIEDDSDTAPYIPTTYINEKEHEQINLLSRYFYEIYMTGSARSLATGWHDLEYEIIDEENAKCAVTGAKTLTADLVIPATTRIGNKEYAVTEIADYAFSDNSDIETVEIPNGIIRIGSNAFSRNTGLKVVYMKDSVELIEGGAFNDCRNMHSIYLGYRLKEFGPSVFSMCTALENVYYSASPESFEKIINNYVVNHDLLRYYTKHKLFHAYIPIHTPTRHIGSVLIDGVTHAFQEDEKDGVVIGISMLIMNESDIVGKEVRILGEISNIPEDHKGNSGFLSSVYLNNLNGYNVIDGMTIATSYDGRIFLSGNPKVPGGCFYSSKGAYDNENKLYFGTHDYWIEGDGIFNTAALLATSDALAVFNSSSASGGGIFYHTPENTNIDMIPKIYPLSYSHLGMSTSANAICFYDDPVFVSGIGIAALSKQDLAMGRKIRTRSSKINSMLLSEDLSAVRLAVWCGYLVVAVGSHIYLGDSRATFTGADGSLEYEWFFLNGIGTYRNDRSVYVYSSAANEDTVLHPLIDTEVKDQYSIFSGKDKDGKFYYWSEDDGVRYAINRTGEMTGGTFYPLTEICVVADRLFFGTECGDVCVFNNDMRGVAPEHIRCEPDFDEAEYKSVYGRRIHSSYYSFANHSTRYALKTPWDNGGIPHLLKNTDKKSSTVKCRAFSGGSITFEVGTDSSGYKEICRFPSSSFSFSDIDFSNLGLVADDSFTALLSEREKGWIEKQTALYSDEFCSPIGIYNIAYRFTIRGKLKTSI